MIRKIAITGPESTGKSTLSELLANYFKTAWVPEYSRKYLTNISNEYQLEDVINIAKGQLENEKKLEKQADKFLFCDTEFINFKIWCLHKYKTCPEWIEKTILSNTYDLVLLCNIDIPWEPDPLRENPDNREFFFNWFNKELQQYNFNYRTISGNVFQRLEKAIQIINTL